MVRASFIVEGKVEKLLIDYLDQTGWLSRMSIEKVGPAIDVKGGGNLCPRNISVYIDMAKTKEPDWIIILTDLECDPCITQTKQRVGNCDCCIIIIAKKAIEAWFLADNVIVAHLTNNKIKYIEQPEETEYMPYDTIKKMMKQETGRGPGMKVKLAKQVFKAGFSIERAMQHPNCKSIHYFNSALEGLSVVQTATKQSVL